MHRFVIKASIEKEKERQQKQENWREKVCASARSTLQTTQCPEIQERAALTAGRPGLHVCKQERVDQPSSLQVSSQELQLFYYRDIRTLMFIVVQFIIGKSWKQPACPSTDEQMKKIWYLYKTGHSTIKKDKFQTFSGKWIHLKNIILKKINQTYKLKYHVLSLF